MHLILMMLMAAPAMAGVHPIDDSGTDGGGVTDATMGLMPDADPASTPTSLRPDGPKPAPAKVLQLVEKTTDEFHDAYQQQKTLRWAGAISALLWLLIAVARRWGRILMSGTAVRIFVVVAGAVAGLLGHLAAGVGWAGALTLFVSGPGALAINELIKLFANPSRPAGD